MSINPNSDRKGLYDSPFVMVYMVETEGVLCQSGGSTSDDLEPGTSWDDKLWNG